KRSYVARTCSTIESEFFDFSVPKAPGLRLCRYPRRDDVVDEPPLIVLNTVALVHRGCLPRVITMVPHKFTSKRANLTAQHAHSPRNIRIDMPAQKHVFMKAMNVEKI